MTAATAKWWPHFSPMRLAPSTSDRRLSSPATTVVEGDHGSVGRSLRVAPELVQFFGEFLLDAVEEVSVHPQRHRRVRVAHPLGDGEDVGASIDQQAGVRVAQVVGPQSVGQTGGPQRWSDHRLAELVPFQRAALGPEEEIAVSMNRTAVLIGSVGEHGRELLCEPGWDGNHPVAGVGLRGSGDKAVVLATESVYRLQRFRDVERVAGEVDRSNA